MDWDIAQNCLFIMGARICDVSLGTLRTVSVITGRRWAAPLLGFVEVLVWILVVSQVIETIDKSPYYPVAYALGFAIGNFIGISIERRLAFGEQVVRVFSRLGRDLARTLRAEGFRVTEFEGRGRDGPVEMLFIETKRREVPSVIRRARAMDPECFYIVDDVRVASAGGGGGQIGGLRSILKGK